MRVGNVMSVVCIVAGIVTFSSAMAAADDGDDAPPVSMSDPSPEDSATTTSLDDTASSDDSPVSSVDPTTSTSDASTTSSTPTTDPDVTTASLSTTSTTSTTTAASTTTSTVEATRLADAALRPLISLRGLCATGTPRVFVFAVSNLGSDPVDVTLVLKGATLQTLTLAVGDVVGFRTPAAGTVSALVGGTVVASADNATLPCPVGAGRPIGFGGLCHDAVAGYEWLLGNSGPPVDVEVRLEGTVVGTFTLASGGFAGFTTPTGGLAQAYVGGVKVAEARASEGPCIPTDVNLSDPCFDRNARLYRWSIFSSSTVVVTVEFDLDGVPLRRVSISPSEGFFDFTTKTGGTGDLVVDGRVVSRVVSQKRPCDSPVSVRQVCADAASGSVWTVSNQGPLTLVVSVVLDGVHVRTETLAPRRERQLHTDLGARLQLVFGDLVLADSAIFPENLFSQPCVTVVGICTDGVDGHVWQIQAVVPAQVDVRVGDSQLGSFHLAGDGTFPQVTSKSDGTAKVYIDGILVSEGAASPDPCVELFASCVDTDAGLFFATIANRRNVDVLAEVRLDGATVARFDLAPYEPKDFAVARAGEMQLILHGDVVATVSTPAGSCGPSVEVSAYCSDDASHRYYWVVDTERFYAVSAELRQAGHRVGTMLLQPFDYILVVSRDASDLQAVVDGVVVGESPASNQPCEVIPEDAIVLAAEETGGATLPVTGGRGDGLIPIGLLLLASGVTLLVATRRWAVR